MNGINYSITDYIAISKSKKCVPVQSYSSPRLFSHCQHSIKSALPGGRCITLIIISIDAGCTYSISWGYFLVSLFDILYSARESLLKRLWCYFLVFLGRWLASLLCVFVCVCVYMCVHVCVSVSSLMLGARKT